jgi:hypothetical protein
MIPSGARVWIAMGYTDMRKGMQGLALLVQQGLKRDPHGGDLFVFRGRAGSVSWGGIDNVTERFTAAGISPNAISCTPTLYSFRLPQPPAELLDAFRHYYGPTMNAFDAAQKDGRARELYDRLSALFEAQNEGGSGETVIAAKFLKVSF